MEEFHKVAEIAEKLKACAIACTGDWFHRKGKVTFAEANDLLAILSRWRQKGFAPIGILGNHDIISIEAMDTRPAGSFIHSGLLQLLDAEPYTHVDGDGTLYVTGTSYFSGCDSSDLNRVRMYGAEPWQGPNPEKVVHVHLAHGALIQRGEFFQEYTVAEDLIPLLHEAGCLPDIIVCGHLHFPEGIKAYKAPDGRTVHVCRIGSAGQVARDDLERIPNALVIATKGKTVVLKEAPIGVLPKRGTEDGPREPGRDPEEHDARIKDFVRLLRDEADAFALSDHQKLIETVAARMGYGKQVTDLALAAVMKRQE